MSEPVFLGLNEGTWFAIIALFLTMVVSIVATVFGYRSASKDRESRITLSDLDHKHDKEMAREARIQDRLESAYADLETHMDRLSDVVGDRLQRARLKPEPPPVEFPPPAEQRQIIARVKLHGSSEVRKLMDEMFSGFMRFRLSIGSWEELVSFGPGRGVKSQEVREAYDKMEKDGQKVLDTISNLEAHMRKELGMVEPAQENESR